MALRRANGSGSIIKIKGKNRRKPYRVRITTGWVVDEETGKARQVVKDIGCFATQNEAINALQEYVGNPYDLTTKKMTFAELYDVWYKHHQEKVTTASHKRSIESAWRYCSALYNVPIRDIRSYHLKECIRLAEAVETRGSNKGAMKKASPVIQSKMKSVFNLMYDFAYEHDLVHKNYARAFNLDTKIWEAKDEAKRQNHEFTSDEINTLWSSLEEIKFADMILVGIYSGWRPQELATLKIADIDFENNTMRGGLKTNAGKNRIVPIHPDIKQLIVARYQEAQELGSLYLFNDVESLGDVNLTYIKYSLRFRKIMKQLDMNHHPHETRHTFYTVANRCGMPELIRDRIVGHAKGLSKVYDHQGLADIQREMVKLKFV